MDTLENFINILHRMKESIHEKTGNIYSMKELKLFALLGITDAVIYIMLFNYSENVCLDVFSIYVIVVSLLGGIVFLLEMIKIKKSREAIIKCLIIIKYVILVITIPFTLVLALFNINYSAKVAIKRLISFVLTFSIVAVMTVILAQRTVLILIPFGKKYFENNVPLYFLAILLCMFITNTFALLIIKRIKDKEFTHNVKRDVKMSEISLLVIFICATAMFPSYCERSLFIPRPSELNTALSLYTIIILLLDKKRELYDKNKNNSHDINE